MTCWRVLCALALLAAAHRADAQIREISFANGYLTVQAANAAIADVIDEVAKIAAVEVTGSKVLTGKTSADVQALPLDKALEVLLADFNFLLSRRSDPDASTRYTLKILSKHDPAKDGDRQALVIPALEAFAFAERQAASSTGDASDADGIAEAQSEAEEHQTELREREVAGEFGADVPFDDLTLEADDANPLIRRRVLEALLDRGTPEALPYLIGALGDDDPDVADFVVQTLGRLRDAASLKRVGDAIGQNGDTSIRIRGLRVFALRADPAAATFVKALVNDADETVRDAATQLLAALERRRRGASRL